VHAFAAEGSRIVLCDVDGDQAARVAEEARGLGAADVALLVADLTEPEVAEQAAGLAAERWGGIDVLVNNVGWSVPSFIAEDTDRDRWQRTVEINFYTAVAATQAVLPSMRAAGAGSIVFVSSDAAFGQI